MSGYLDGQCLNAVRKLFNFVGTIFDIIAKAVGNREIFGSDVNFHDDLQVRATLPVNETYTFTSSGV
jgi:predicted LPLAT superfamily acyltransferase